MTTNTTEYYQLSQFPKIEDRNTILNETTDDNKKIDKALRNHHNRIVVIEEDKLKIHSSINSITEKLNTDETQIEANRKAITDINNMSDGTTILNKKISDIDGRVKTIEGTTVDTTNFATKEQVNTNTQEIANLEGRVTTLEGTTVDTTNFVTKDEFNPVRDDVYTNIIPNVTDLREQVNTNTQGIAQNKSDIDEIKKKISVEATTTTITNIQGMPTEISIGNMQTLSFSVSITATTTDTETLATGEFKLTFDKSNNMFTIYASPSATLGAHQVPYLVGTETKYITVTVKEYKNYIVGFTPYNNGLTLTLSLNGNQDNWLNPGLTKASAYQPSLKNNPLTPDTTTGIGIERASREGDYIDADEPVMINSVLQKRTGTLAFNATFGNIKVGDYGYNNPSWIATIKASSDEVGTTHKAGYYTRACIGAGNKVSTADSTSYNYIITASNSTGTKTSSTTMTIEGVGVGS